MSVETDHMIEIPDYEAIRDAFADELRLASEGKPSSISFIKHQLPERPLVTEGIVQGIVIGGTNYILSTEKVHADGSREIIKRSTGILPTFTTKEILGTFFRDHLDPRANAIGLNFAFPIQPYITSAGILDAKFIMGTKEHTFAGLTQPIGEFAAMIFEQLYRKRIPVSIANDSICLILADKGKPDGAIIVGTGIGMGIRHKNDGRDVLVNLEPGNFNKFVTFSSLEKIDAQSEKPKEYLFEKSISGKYLFEHFNYYIEEFGLITPPIQNSLELSAISIGKHNESIINLSRQIITHSARMVACAITGVYNFWGQPKSLTFIGEGNLLKNGWHYQSTIENQLQKFGISENIIKMEHINDSSINGAIGLVTHS